MFDFKNIKGSEISTELCGIKLQSPFILSSGPLSYAAEGLIRAHEAGAGAVVTKTLRKNAAINPVPHIGKINNDSLINCEKWADEEAEVFIKKYIPETKKAGAVVIGSVGHTPPEAELLVKDVEKAGADIIELVSYSEETMLPMLKIAKDRVSIPVICKLSGNWPDPVSTAKKCLELGADGISAIDSIGPTLKIDIKSAKPEMNSKDGYGWLSGGAIRPIALRIVSEIARNGCKNLVGIGGVTRAEDAVEYLMAGASGIGICSIAILRGIEMFSKLNKDLAILLEQLGYNSITSVKGVALPNFPKEEKVAKLKFNYNPDSPPCQNACPAGVDVPLYIDQVRRGHYIDAYQTVSAANPLPAICGRVCDHPCEEQCRRAKTDEALQIRLLKRIAADKTFDCCGDSLPLPSMLPKNGKKIAIIGSGPAGLSAAYYLARNGYSVKIYEKLPVAGGMLAVGIPDYRLPKDILTKEIDRIKKMGVEIRTGIEVGKDISIEDIKAEGFEKIIIATGAHGDPDINIPGNDLEGVLSAIKFLRDVNLGRPTDLHNKKVVVIGGGNVAIDAARTAVRMGAKEVIIVYRRRREDMPAIAEEIKHAEEEGIRFIFLAGPCKFEGENKLEKFYYQPMKLGEADNSGRPRPIPKEESPVELDVDIALLATGQKVTTDFIPPVKDNESGITNDENIFVAGDCLTGPSSVIEAIAAGKISASKVDISFGNNGIVEERISCERMHFVEVAEDDTAREEQCLLPTENRIPGFSEVELGLPEDAARREAYRCLHCGCINCKRCVAACSYNARVLDYPEMKVDEDLCRSCGLCVSVCPTGALTAEIVDC